MIIGFAVVLIYSATLKSKSLEAFRAEAAAQFDMWLAGEPAKQLGLEPGACEVVKREESIGRDETVVNSYTLTLFLRARTGRYVMFKSTPTGPYVKLVEPAVARVVLKDKYVPN
jgi:hypothetical protein